MFGKKRVKERCPSCDRALHEGQKVCACGKATLYMDFAERTAWEVEQWREHVQTARAS
ncbi:MAG: hypothetical protein ACXVQS_10310 [Actinomycetota bacterium]